MGSPYLMAHGMGMPVHNAKTTAHFPESGRYHVWVRTKNWVPGDWEPPGKFHVRIDDQTLENEFGVNPSWSWEYGGEIARSEEDTSELQSLMRNSYVVFCLKKKITHRPPTSSPI